jgi:hypothetical protein
MKPFDLSTLTALLTAAATLIGTEVYNVLKGKAKTLDPATQWSLADKWLAAHSKFGDIVFRVATVAFLAWSVLHVAAGIPLP